MLTIEQLEALAVGSVARGDYEGTMVTRTKGPHREHDKPVWLRSGGCTTYLMPRQFADGAPTLVSTPTLEGAPPGRYRDKDGLNWVRVGSGPISPELVEREREWGPFTYVCSLKDDNPAALRDGAHVGDAKPAPSKGAPAADFATMPIQPGAEFFAPPAEGPTEAPCNHDRPDERCGRCALSVYENVEDCPDGRYWQTITQGGRVLALPVMELRGDRRRYRRHRGDGWNEWGPRSGLLCSGSRTLYLIERFEPAPEGANITAFVIDEATHAKDALRYQTIRMETPLLTDAMRRAQEEWKATIERSHREIASGFLLPAVGAASEPTEHERMAEFFKPRPQPEARFDVRPGEPRPDPGPEHHMSRGCGDSHATRWTTAWSQVTCRDCLAENGRARAADLARLVDVVLDGPPSTPVMATWLVTPEEAGTAAKRAQRGSWGVDLP